MWKSIIELLNVVFAFGTKVIPTDKMRETSQEIRMQRVTGNEFTRIYDVCYRRLKSHTEIDVADDVKYNYPTMPEDQRRLLIDNLKKRILEHRKKHPVIYRKWLLSQSKLLTETNI